MMRHVRAICIAVFVALVSALAGMEVAALASSDLLGKVVALGIFLVLVLFVDWPGADRRLP